MNFVGILFQLLITGLFYKCCHQVHNAEAETDYDIDLKGVEVWDYGIGNHIGDFTSAYLYKYKDEDSFVIGDTVEPILHRNIFRNAPFTSSQFEFVSMYANHLLSLFRRKDDNTLVYVLCKFSNKDHLQTFFDSINSGKLMDDTIRIHSMYRYEIPDASSSNYIPRMVPFVGQAELSVRIITGLNVQKVAYYVTHVSNTNGNIVVDMIFVSQGFSVSATTDNNVIALCITHAPKDRGFVVRFPDGENQQEFRNNYLSQNLQSDHVCDFSDAWLEQIPLNN